MHNYKLIDLFADGSLVDAEYFGETAELLLFSLGPHVPQVGRGELLKLYKLLGIDNLDHEKVVMGFGKRTVTLTT